MDRSVAVLLEAGKASSQSAPGVVADLIFISNWEGFSPDPYTTGVASYLTVTGMQDAGTLTTAKHWVGYEQETYRYGLVVYAVKA